MNSENNLKLANIFLNLARILGMEDEKKNKFRIIAYQNAARTLQTMNEDVQELFDGETLPKISGFGPAIQEKIISFLQTGHIPAYDQWLEQYPESFLALFSIPHIGPKTAKILLEEYQVTSVHELEMLVNTDKLTNHEGFGEKSVQNIREALTRVKKESQRSPLAAVFPVVYRLLTYMKANNACKKITYAGSLRRFEDTIGDVDLLATSLEAEKLIQHFCDFPEAKVVQSQGDTKASIVVENNLQIDLRVVEPKSFGAALQYFTGSKDHNVHLRNIAKDKGLKLNEYGIFRGEENIASETEEEIYETLGLYYIPPEIRRNQGEVEEAEKQAFPHFVSLSSLEQNPTISEQECIEVQRAIWENYPVLLNTIHEITKAKKTPLLRFGGILPNSSTWQIISREAKKVAIDFTNMVIEENWKKEIVIGLMRRARIETEKVYLLGK